MHAHCALIHGDRIPIHFWLISPSEKVEGSRLPFVDGKTVCLTAGVGPGNMAFGLKPCSQGLGPGGSPFSSLLCYKANHFGNRHTT